MNVDRLIFDGRHMLYRCCDAFSDLSTEIDGREIGCGGIYGFLSTAVKIHRRYRGKVYVAWEGRSSRNFRRQIFPDYKRRDEPDAQMMAFLQDMGEQELRLKGLLRTIGVDQYAGADCEADDVMGYLAQEAVDWGETAGIYTGDSDLRQCVRDGVSVFAPSFRGNADKIYSTPSDVEERHGVPPKYLPDLKALAGDSSDNIPGVRGVGQKTAEKLVQAFGPLQAIIDAAHDPNSDWPVAERFRASIKNCEELPLYLELTTLRKNPKVKRIKPRRDKERARAQFVAYRFQSLLSHSEFMDVMRLGK